MEKKKILLIGGGTGGHIIPLKNLAEELIKKGNSVEIIVSDSKLDKKIISENFARFKTHFFKTDKIRRYLSIHNLLAPFKILKSIFYAKKLLKEIQPNIVFFKGGFLGFPFLASLFLSGFPGKIYAHESDIEKGKLTLLAEKIADKVFYSFGEPSYPLFFSSENSAKKIGNKKKKLLVFGGSQGAKFINELVADNIDKIAESFDTDVITGVGKLLKIKKIAGFSQIEMLTAQELGKKIKESDIIVSRAGANSLFEIISAKKPSLIIPLPSAAKNHQEKNANFFAKKNLCHIFHQKNNDDFYRKLVNCLEDKELKNSLQKSDIQNSAKKIAKEISST